MHLYKAQMPTMSFIWAKLFEIGDKNDWMALLSGFEMSGMKRD